MKLFINQQRAHSSALVTACVACIYIAFTLVALGTHEWNPQWFVWQGEKFANLDPNGHVGYDGQFVFYIARDGFDAVPHLDNPPYRLQRILLPAVVRILSLSQAGLMPWVLITVNLAAIMLATWVLARWLTSSSLSPWYAAAYALFVGTFMAFSRDLVEPLAFCLATIGTVCWLNKVRVPAVILFALALLTKETVLLFVLGLAAAEFFSRRFGKCLLILTAALPLLAWEVFLYAQFGRLPMTAGPSLQLIPLAGILPYLNAEPGRISAFACVAMPALALAIAAVCGLVRNARSHAHWILLLNCILALAMPIAVYDHIMHAGRNADGLILAAVFCMPCWIRPARLAALAWWVMPTVAWLVPVLRWAPWLSLL
jgi:hypothetical protein